MTGDIEFSQDRPNVTYNGVKIYFDTTLTETKYRTVDRTFRERWLDPFLHPCTISFEPWIKTKSMPIKVPSKKIISRPWGLIMHPITFQYIEMTTTKTSREVS